MGNLSHLDALEAEAIYYKGSCSRMRKAGNAVFYRKGQLSYASSCNESILS